MSVKCHAALLGLLLLASLCVAEDSGPEGNPTDASKPEDSALNDLIQATERTRGLKFKQPVPFERLAEAPLKELLAHELENQYSDSDWANIRDTFALLGALPPDLDLKSLYHSLLSEQVGGLYDPHKGKMFMVGDLSLTNSISRIILEHELTHALTDQHFKLLSLPVEDKNNDDRSLAAMSLVEGDATLSMAEYCKSMDVRDMLATAFAGLFMNQDVYVSSPPIIQGILLFPYVAGETFLLQACQGYNLSEDGRIVQGGLQAGEVNWDLVNYLYEHPPQSSEQVMHPGKYFESRDDPKEVGGLEECRARLGEGWQVVWENTCGEFLIKSMLMERVSLMDAKTSSEGWGGDRCLLFHGPSGEKALAWKTVWDSEEDAREFQDAMAKSIRKGAYKGHVSLRPLDPAAPLEAVCWAFSSQASKESFEQGMKP